MSVQRGSLVLADIGGYTRYLTSVELEHSHDILADLVNTVVTNLGAVFRLAKLEGDAVFCYDLEESPNGQSLLGAIEGTYFAFRRKLRDIAHLTTCRCNACAGIPALELKFVAHHGSFVLHDVAGNPELVGPDVITVHRLLKNEIIDSTGMHAYAFLTEACIDRCTLEPDSMGLKRHLEHYDDVGDVAGYVLDLAERWETEEKRTAVFVSVDDAALEVAGEVAAPPPALWDMLTSPERAYEWFLGLESMTEDHPSGMRGVGTVNHCVHGGMAIDNQIVDWKPFHYYTQRTASPMGSLLITLELSPVDGGTRLVYRMKFESELPEEMRGVAVEMLRTQISTNAENIKRAALQASSA
jgi:uncharacterized protein YndB with AHSA1/START domain